MTGADYKREKNSRTAMVIGDTGVKKLGDSRVIVFGIGGVGGYTAEALARAGVGEITLVDADTVSVSNINRQIIALNSTVGENKTDVMKRRIADIDPDIKVNTYTVFVTPENVKDFDLVSYDYAVDAIDTLSAKIALIKEAHLLGLPIISAMGAGNKLDPTCFRVSDISKTKVDPLARAVRVALRKCGINHLKVVYSEEEPRVTDADGGEKADGRRAPGSLSFVPSVMGLIIGGEVIKDLCGSV